MHCGSMHAHRVGGAPSDPALSYMAGPLTDINDIIASETSANSQSPNPIK
jgi:hypothetical protein